MEELNSMALDELGKLYIEQNKLKIQLENKIGHLNTEISMTSNHIVEKMNDRDVSMIEIEGLKISKVIDENFGLEHDADGVKIDEWDDPEGRFFKWLDEIGESALIKTKKSVHAGTRKSWLKNRRKEGKNLPEFIKVSFFERVKINMSEIKRRVVDAR